MFDDKMKKGVFHSVSSELHRYNPDAKVGFAD